MKSPQDSERHAWQPPDLRSWTGRLSRLALILPLAACSTGVDGGDGGTGDPGPTLAVVGTLWCAETVGAYGKVSGMHELIVDGSQAPAKFCECLSEQVDADLDQLVALNSNSWDLDLDSDDDINVSVVGGITYIQLGDETETEGFSTVYDVRNTIINGAESACIAMRDDLGYTETTNPSLFPGCGNIADNTDEPDFRDPGPDVLALYKPSSPDCNLSDQLEIDDGGYSGTYTLSNVIEFNTGTSTYEIDEEFFDKMISNPDWWLEDGTTIEKSSGAGYELDNVETSDISYALGLRDGDRFISVDSMSLDTIEDVVDAIDALENNDDFTLVVKRGGSNITLEYEKVP
jgi:hypothetical protein